MLQLILVYIPCLNQSIQDLGQMGKLCLNTKCGFCYIYLSIFFSLDGIGVELRALY
jgi:hypothetical protein